MGQLSLQVNAISDTDISITGTTNYLSNLKAEFLANSVVKSVEGTSDDTGFFSLILPEVLQIDTVVKVTANDNFKNRIENLTVVYAGVLEFKTVPSLLAFKNTVILTVKTTVSRQESDWSIVVADSRIKSSDWNLYAFIKNPFTSANNNTLKDALVFIDEKNQSFTLNSEPTELYSGKSVLSPTDTTIKWSENQGILLDINPQDIMDESYSTTITWTLTDAP